MKVKLMVIAVAAALSAGAYAADEAKKDTKASGKDSAPMAQQQGAKNGGSASAGSSAAGQGSASAGASGKQAGQRAQAHSPDMVKQVQQSLKDKGIDAGPIDGRYGPLTQKGVKQFQEQQNMKATGQLDQQTLSALGVSGSASAGASGQGAAAGSAKDSGAKSGGASAGSSGSAGAGAKSGNGASAGSGAAAPKAPKDAAEQSSSGSSNDGSAGARVPAGGNPGASK